MSEAKKKRCIIIAAIVIIVALISTALFFVLKNIYDKADDGKMFVITKISDTECNLDGTPYEMTLEWKDGKVVRTDNVNGSYEYTYNNIGEMTARLKLDDDGSKIVCKEDENGNIISEKTYYGENLNCTHKYEYDKNGNKIKETNYNSADFKCSQATYDTHGSLIEWKVFNTNGSVGISEKTKYKYDDRGNITEEIKYNSDGEISSSHKIKYEYDKKGRILKEELFSEGQFLKMTEYKYNRDSLMTEKINYNSDKEVFTTISYEYDKYGNLIKETLYHTDGSEGDSITYVWKETTDKSAAEFSEKERFLSREQFGECVHLPADAQ